MENKCITRFYENTKLPYISILDGLIYYNVGDVINITTMTGNGIGFNTEKYEIRGVENEIKYEPRNTFVFKTYRIAKVNY